MTTFTARELRLMMITGFAGLVVGALAISVTRETAPVSQLPEERDPMTAAENTDADPTRADIASQPAGRAVRIISVEMPIAGWIAVHELDPDGMPLNALGAQKLDAGSHENVIVSLLRGTEPDARYGLMLYEDDGDGAFEVRGDRRLDEMPVAQFTATTPLSPLGR